MANKPLSGLGKMLYEAEVTYANDPGGAGTYLPVLGTVDFGGAIRRAYEDETLRQKMVSLKKLMDVSGRTDCEFSFSFYLRGFSATAPAVAPTQNYVMDMIGAALGGVVASTDTPTLSLAGSTSSVVKCTDGSLDQGNSTFAGGFYGFEVNGGPACEGRFATALDEEEATPSDELSILPLGDSDATIVLSNAPNGTTDKVHTGVTAYHVDQWQSTAPSYTFTWQSHGDEDYIHLLGCRPTRLSITMTVGEIPRVEMTWRAVGFTSGDAGSVLAASAIVSPPPQVFADAARCFLTTGSARISPLLIKSASYNYEIELAEESDPTNTTNAFGVQELTKVNATCKAEMDPLFDDNGDVIEGWREAQTGLYHEVSYGTLAGTLIGIRMPYAYLDGSYTADRSGLRTKPITLSAGDYETEASDDVHTYDGGTPPDDLAPADANCISKIFSVGVA